MAGQAADRCHAGNADQDTAAARLHAIDKGVKGGGHADIVDHQGFAQDIEVFAHDAVYAYADARVGYHQIRQALGCQTRVPRLHNAVDLRHIRAINTVAFAIELLALRPVLYGLRAARDQGHIPARLVKAQRQRLTDAAGGAGDKDKFVHAANIPEASAERKKPRPSGALEKTAPLGRGSQRLT